jgi:GAF domain-containing protein
MAQHQSEPDHVLAQLGLVKLGDTDLPGILHRVAHLAQQTLTGATEVSITIVDGRRTYTAASTGDLALHLDHLQYQHHRGPCLQAASEQNTVLVPDTSHHTGWTPWPAHAAAAGARSVLSVPLPILDDLDGALNIYATTPDAFGPDAVTTAETYAQHAAVTLANAHRYDRTANLAQQMQTAMEHRAVIEQAKGIIMAERRCTPDEAFAILTKMSQDSNRKLRHIATTIVTRTQTPPQPHH